MSFKYKFGDECTDTINERRVILPEGVTVVREASSKNDEKGYRERLIKNLLNSELVSTVKAGNQDTAAMIKEEVDAMVQENHS